MSEIVQTPLLIGALPNGTPKLMYAAWPKQIAFHQSDITNLIAIGSRGSGKSLALRMDAHMRAMSVPGCSLILVRKTYKDLLKSHMIHLPAEMKLLGGHFNKTDYIAYYPNGSKLFLSYVGHSEDSMNLLSAEFLAAYFDELSVIPWEYFIKLCASVRVPVGSGLKAVVRAATNPLGESAGDINRYFVTKEVDPEEDPDYMPDEWGHVRIDMQDNPSLDIEQYKKRFAGLSEHVKAAWLYGEFMEENTLFSFFPRKNGKPHHVITELDIDDLVKKAKIYRCYDHGYAPDPAYCAWIAHLGNRYIVFHEKKWLKTIVSDIAASIKEEDAKLGVSRVIATYCDPTIDIQTGADVRTIKGLFELHGIPMECAVNNRAQYASHVHTALAEEVNLGTDQEPFMVPRLQIYRGYGYRSGAPYLIKAIPLQRFDEKKPLAMANNAHDHPVVALSYFLMSHSADEQTAFSRRELKPWMREKRQAKIVLGSEGVRLPR